MVDAASGARQSCYKALTMHAPAPRKPQCLYSSQDTILRTGKVILFAASSQEEGADLGRRLKRKKTRHRERERRQRLSQREAETERKTHRKTDRDRGRGRQKQRD